MQRFLQAAAVVIMAVFMTEIGCTSVHAEVFKVGTWKTAQTIQPFFYQDFLSEQDTVKVYPFTNPADQKSALLAGSLDMCGTTLAHAIHSASMGQPVVLVAALCNKCSAFVVKKDAGIESVVDLKGKKIGYVPGTMHEILLRETLTRNGLSPRTDVQLLRVDFFDMGLALSQGDIHAFLSGEPFPTLAEE
ncbi:MAG: NrtA/SsuA/CpmA family ABC transporter substrate-binding protein, partial [Desulfovermiculus sp.]|nr:NrtA/SsuA/CpmA family ABC transporter substrate-binding protein [Desulfovermiculus sp.]